MGWSAGDFADVLDVAHAFTPDLCSPIPVEPNPPLASVAARQTLDLDEARATDRHDDDLGDAIAGLDAVGLACVGVEQGDLDLAAIAGVDRARRVDDRDAVREGEPPERGTTNAT